ncbi:hypothetical protein [Muriicola sp.]|uniref:hypothetical protein n=1 Tax=Muriicola sp. TaxID=2020856 RepID=UPI003C77D0E0
MKVKLKKLALLVEVLGGIGILISLVFVGIQLKENTKATRSSTATATIDTMTNWYVTMGTNAETSASFYRFLEDPESMTKEERLQHIYNFHGLFLAFQNSYYLSLEGTLDERIPKSLNQVIYGVKDQPGFKLYWKSRKSIFFEEYRGYVDDLLNSTDIVSDGVYYNENSD